MDRRDILIICGFAGLAAFQWFQGERVISAVKAPAAAQASAPNVTSTSEGQTVTIGDTAGDLAEKAARARGYYTPNDLARHHQESPREMTRRLNSGELPGEMVDGRWRTPLTYRSD